MAAAAGVAGRALLAVFGEKLVEGIGKAVTDFDFNKMDVTDSEADDHLHIGLAPAFGTLTKESLMAMDNELKVMITATMRALEGARKESDAPLSWDTVLSVLSQNSLLEPSDGKVDKHDSFMKNDTNFFKFDGSPDPGVVEQVQSWFKQLIADEDVLQSTMIDINVMANIVAQTGATITGLETLIYKKEHHEKTIVDIGVLRFPDPDHPYFKVYRIKLVAWSTSFRVGPVQRDTNGINGDFNVRNFRPRDSVIAGLSQDILDKAVAEAEDLLR